MSYRVEMNNVFKEISDEVFSMGDRLLEVQIDCRDIVDADILDKITKIQNDMMILYRKIT